VHPITLAVVVFQKHKEASKQKRSYKRFYFYLKPGIPPPPPPRATRRERGTSLSADKTNNSSMSKPTNRTLWTRIGTRSDQLKIQQVSKLISGKISSKIQVRFSHHASEMHSKTNQHLNRLTQNQNLGNSQDTNKCPAPFER